MSHTKSTSGGFEWIILDFKKRKRKIYFVLINLWLACQSVGGLSGILSSWTKDTVMEVSRRTYIWWCILAQDAFTPFPFLASVWTTELGKLKLKLCYKCRWVLWRKKRDQISERPPNSSSELEGIWKVASGKDLEVSNEM